MIAEIINIGTELIMGDTLNINALILGRLLSENGINVKYITMVQDNERDIYDALETARKRVRFVITTGGLGPTRDDITKKVIAEFLDLPLIYDENLMQKIKQSFAERNIEMPESNLVQSLVPKGAVVLDNPKGTACGFLIEQERNIFLLLPGVPDEMEFIVVNSFIPYLKEKFPLSNITKSRTLKIIGAIESEIGEKISDFMEQPNPKVSILSDKLMVKIRISVNARDESSANLVLDNVEDKIRERLGSDLICCVDEEEIEDIIVSLLSLKRYTISTAESCTGGMLSSFLTNVPGVSRFFKGGIVVYSNEAKMKFFDIPENIILDYGAVSEQVVRIMAQRVTEKFNTDIGIAISGIAGPTGGTEDKPVGTVCFGLNVNGSITSCTHHFTGDRKTIRKKSALTALDLLRLELIKNG